MKTCRPRWTNVHIFQLLTFIFLMNFPSSYEALGMPNDMSDKNPTIFFFFTKCQFVINCISCFHEVWVQSSLHDQAVVVNEWWFYLKHYTIWAKSHLVSPVYLSMVALYRASSHIRFSLFVTKYSSFLGCKWQRSWPSLVSKTELSRNFWVLPSVGCQCLGCALSCSPDETYNCRLHKSIASSSSKQPTHNLDK